MLSLAQLSPSLSYILLTISNTCHCQILKMAVSQLLSQNLRKHLVLSTFKIEENKLPSVFSILSQKLRYSQYKKSLNFFNFADGGPKGVIDSRYSRELNCLCYLPQGNEIGKHCPLMKIPHVFLTTHLHTCIHASCNACTLAYFQTYILGYLNACILAWLNSCMVE